VGVGSCLSDSTTPGLFLQGGNGTELVAALLESPGIRDAADRLKATPERRISAGQEGAPRHVYVFQREYATVDPARVEVRGVALSRLDQIGLGIHR